MFKHGGWIGFLFLIACNSPSSPELPEQSRAVEERAVEAVDAQSVEGSGGGGPATGPEEGQSWDEVEAAAAAETEKSLEEHSAAAWERTARVVLSGRSVVLAVVTFSSTSTTTSGDDVVMTARVDRVLHGSASDGDLSIVQRGIGGRLGSEAFFPAEGLPYLLVLEGGSDGLRPVVDYDEGFTGWALVDGTRAEFRDFEAVPVDLVLAIVEGR